MTLKVLFLCIARDDNAYGFIPSVDALMLSTQLVISIMYFDVEVFG